MFSGRQLTLSDYWLILRRRKWLLILPLMIIPVGTALWSFSLPNVYSATTLILVVATPDLVAAAQVGDGAAVVDGGNGEIISLTVPHWGQYINETTFLNSRGALKKAQINVWRGATKHVAAFTDGLQAVSLNMPKGTPHLPFFAPLFSFVSEATDSIEAHQQLERFMRSQRVAESTGDDLTLLLFGLVESCS